MAGSYAWLTFAQAKTQLAQRLAADISTDNAFWKNAELGIRIQQALRQYNILTQTWKTDFQFVNSGPGVWSSLATLAGSPRIRTITDSYCYTDMEYHLLEPPTAGVWSGTNQFTISDLSQALQRRRDEMLIVSACNDVLVTGIPSTPAVSRILMPDNTLDVPRLRFIPVDATNNAGVTLYRDDAVALEFYEAPLYELPPQMPQTYSLSSEPPLSFDVFPPPNVAGTYEGIVLQSGLPFVPPVPTLIGIPDDLAFVLEYGALGDLFGRESESTDRERADYCTKRYLDGLILMQKTPWIMLGKVNGAAVSVDALASVDRYDVDWDSNPTGFGPVVVTAGMDMLASPVNSSTGVTCLASAPVPVLDTDFIQCSRSSWDAVLDLAQASCLLKEGGAEWKAGLELEQRAIQFCASENSRLKSTGAFADVFLQRGQLEDMNQQRYNSKADQKG